MSDVFFLICDGLKGVPDSANAVFPLATVQTGVIHLIRGTFRYASKRYWEGLAKDLRPIYTAPTGQAAWVGGVRGPRAELGRALPGHPQALASQLGTVHALPGLRRRDQ